MENVALDELKSRHTKEKKELKGKITALKHGVTKDDKKRRKEVTQQCEKMESELKVRHKTEMDELENRVASMEMAKAEECNGKLSIQNPAIAETSSIDVENGQKEAEDEPAPFFKEVKLTKTQLKKDKKRAEKAAKQCKAMAEDANNSKNSRGNLEIEELQKRLDEQYLQLIEVVPDGDCLYSAVAHQLSYHGCETHSPSQLRRLAAAVISARRDEFLPFLVDKNGEPLDESLFDEYCSKVSRMCAEGGEWGGEPELRALSLALEQHIRVLPAKGRMNDFGEKFSREKPTLTITYHKFAYTLGEHYNSTMNKSILKK